LLGRIVHHPIDLAQIVEEDHDESKAASGCIVFSLGATVCLESRPVFKDQLVEIEDVPDIIHLFLSITITTAAAAASVYGGVIQCLEMICQG